MTGPHRKPQADVYTVLLAIALVAVLLAIVFLYLETADYGTNKTSGAPPVVWVDRAGAPWADGPPALLAALHLS